MSDNTENNDDWIESISRTPEDTGRGHTLTEFNKVAYADKQEAWEDGEKLPVGPQEIVDKIIPAFGQYVSTPTHWFPFLEDLDKELTELLGDYQIAQVKEKFGSLRYYVEYSEEHYDRGLDKLAEDIVHKYEFIIAEHDKQMIAEKKRESQG